MTGAELFVAELKARGVEWISTLCGHGLSPLYAACQNAGVRLVDTRNEQTAAYMAECWGRLSRRVGVCMVSSGVAHANAMTGVVNAYFDGAPMLLITGAGALRTAGMGHFQDLDRWRWHSQSASMRGLWMCRSASHSSCTKLSPRRSAAGRVRCT